MTDAEIRLMLIKMLWDRGATLPQARRLAGYLLAVDQVRAYDGNYEAMADDAQKLNNWKGR